ncbi:MAG: mechanosensitive ion channel family protein [Chitinophagaceae bacterium]|jgi:MscS family membrane protein|nr:mechanosensitive ion channel family protein [Chitinophagaceae bacterium]
MEKILNYNILDNSVKSWLIVIAVIACIYIIVKFVSTVFIGYLLKLLTRVGKNVHREAFRKYIVFRFRKVVLLNLIYAVFLEKLNTPSFFSETFLRHPIGTIVDSAISAILIFYFIRLCVGIVDFAGIVIRARAHSERHSISVNQLVELMRSLLRVVLIIIGGLLFLKGSFNYNIGNLLTGLSLVTAALALAAKESLENLIASFIISIDQPFLIGDRVEVQGLTGIVESIGMRSTRLRTDNKTLITVPNKQMVDSIVNNISMRIQRRENYMLELELSTKSEDIKEALSSMKNILELHRKDGIEQYTLFLKETGGNAHKILLNYLTSIQLSIEEHNLLCQTINLEIIALLQEKNIQFAAESSTINVVRG